MLVEADKKSDSRSGATQKVTAAEQLSDAIRVTNPAVWMVLAAVLLLLAGLLVWACVGTLETTAPAKILVEDHVAQISLPGGQTARAGMPVRAAGCQSVLTGDETDELGRTLYLAELPLPDGVYDGVVVTDQVRPISFLLEGR